MIEVKTSVNGNTANISSNSSAIASTQEEVARLRQEMDNVMKKELKETKDQANDVQRRVYKK